MNLSSLTINQAAPQIFRRPVLSVGLDDELPLAATFMAVGPQIYVDGLVVLDSFGKIAGRIGNQYIMYHILDAGGKWLNTKVSELLSLEDAISLEGSSYLSEAFDLFESSHFAFVPVTLGGKIAATLSLRDLLPLVFRSNVNTPVRDVGSPIITIPSKSSLGDVFRTITDRQIRNVGITFEGGGKGDISIINDRKILEFLSSHEGRQALAGHQEDGIRPLDKIPLETLSLLQPKKISFETAISSAAPLLEDVSAPCILSDGLIVTPWDLVIKGLRRTSV
ncbi:MAG: hypothetical protein ABI361_04365 [Nitrososphaera sp.]